MSKSTTPNLASADRFDGFLVITFDDGRCGIYDSDLLYTMLSQAREVHEEQDVDRQDAEWQAEDNAIAVQDGN